MTVDNAFLHESCSNISCVVECYRGYTYPSGSTVEYYSCQNEEWKPMLSSCKRTLWNLYWSDTCIYG